MSFKLFSHSGKKISFHVWKDGTGNFMHPLRDWVIGFFGAVALFLGGISYIVYDLYTQFDVPNQEVVADSDPVVYNEKDVLYYAKMYKEKENLFQRLRNGI